MIEIRLLGRFSVRRDGSDVPDSAFAGRRTRSLIRLLATQRGSLVPSDVLVEALWPRGAPADPGTNLRVLVNRARKALGDPSMIRTGAGGYSLEGEGRCVIDAEDFVARVQAGRWHLGAGRPAEALRELRAALDNWGEPLAEDAYEQWAQEYRLRLTRTHLDALEAAARAAQATGNPTEAVGYAETAVARDPLRETANLLLVEAYARAGDAAAALDRLRSFRQLLAEELGLDPSPRAVELERNILRGELGGGAGEAPEPAPAAPAVSNLPVALTTFVGREEELRQLRKVVDGARLVTVTGAGGVGKTRLVVELAHGLVEAYGDGVWLADLAPLTESRSVPHAVAAALGLGESGARAVTETVLEHLRPRDLLLILDNCEHVVTGCADLIQRLLGSCPRLRVLASSRERLRVPGEVVYRMPSLSVPPARRMSVEEVVGYDAVRLFVERARAVDPELVVEPEHVPALIEICARLDGIPLAIELAAARADLLPIDHIAARLADPFRLLCSGPRTALPRHRTLRATIDWSHRLLSRPEQLLLRRLSLFQGGFTLDAAEAVCAGEADDGGEVAATEVLDLLDGLVARSLVVVQGQGRYRLLETIRRYAREQLEEAGEDPWLMGRFRSFYLQLAEAAQHETKGSHAASIAGRLAAEQDNFRAAMQSCLAVAGGAETGLALFAALYPVGLFRYYREWLQWVQHLLAQPETPNAPQARAARKAAQLALYISDPTAARQLSELAVDLARRCGDPREEAWALIVLGVLESDRGEFDAARRLLQDSQSIARAIDDTEMLVESLLWLGWAAHDQARYDDAQACARKLTEVAEDGWWYAARPLVMLGWVQREQGDYAAARESFSRFRDLVVGSSGDPEMEALAHEGLGYVAAAEGRLTEARAEYERALALTLESHQQAFIISALGGLGELAAAEGDHWGSRSLVQEALEKARQGGEVFMLAWTLNRLGRIEAAGGKTASAAQAYQEALGICWRTGMQFQLAASFQGLGELAAETGRPELAVRLLATATAVRESIGAPLPPVADAAHRAIVDRLRDVLGDVQFDTAWERARRLDLHDVIQVAAHCGNMGDPGPLPVLSGPG